MSSTDLDRPMMGISLMLAFCLLAPFADALAKLLGPEMAVGQLVTLRFAFQAAILVPLTVATRRVWQMDGRILFYVTLRTLLHIAGISLVFTSLLYLPLADAIAMPIVDPCTSHSLRLWPRLALMRARAGDDADSVLDTLAETAVRMRNSPGERIAWASEDIDHRGLSNQQLEADLLAAIDRDEIEVLFQPQYRVGDNRLADLAGMSLGRVGRGGRQQLEDRALAAALESNKSGFHCDDSAAGLRRCPVRLNRSRHSRQPGRRRGSSRSVVPGAGRSRRSSRPGRY